jgi:hypothetical protein
MLIAEGRNIEIVGDFVGGKMTVTEYVMGPCRFCGREASYIVAEPNGARVLGVFHAQPYCVVYDSMEPYAFVEAHIGTDGLEQARKRGEGAE